MPSQNQNLAPRRGVVRQKAGTYTRITKNKKKEASKKACRNWKNPKSAGFLFLAM